MSESHYALSTCRDCSDDFLTEDMTWQDSPTGWVCEDCIKEPPLDTEQGFDAEFLKDCP